MSVVQPVAHPNALLSYPDEKEHRRQLAQAVNRVNRGQMNVTLQVTLDPSTTTTTVIDSRISKQSAIGFCPITASAAAEVAAGLLHAVPTDGSAVIHHQNSAATDRTFNITLLG